MAEFISVCVFLAERAGEIIRECQQSGENLKQLNKDDHLTIADLRCQETIVTVLKAKWPTLQIVGEEDFSLEDQTVEIKSSATVDDLTEQVCSFISNDMLLEHH